METLSKMEYESLAEFRYILRKFLSFSKSAARNAGVPPAQHQALLAIKGYPSRDHVTIGELAERLQIRHHSAVELVNRLEEQQLVQRQSGADRRTVLVSLTAAGEAILARLSTLHREELRRIKPWLVQVLDQMQQPNISE